MSLIRNQQFLFLIILLCTSVDGDADAPATQGFNEPGKDIAQENRQHEVINENINQKQKESSPLKNEEQNAEVNVKNDFRVGNTGLQDQHLGNQQQNVEPLKQEVKQEVHQEKQVVHQEKQQEVRQEKQKAAYNEKQQELHQEKQYEIPLVQTKDKRIEEEPPNVEPVLNSGTPVLSEADIDVSKEATSSKEAIIEEQYKVDLKAPPHEHTPLSKTPLNADEQAEKLTEEQQPVPGTTIFDISSDQEHSDGSEQSVVLDKEKDNTEKPPTEEELEGERLFQAGEKLINATYYKEYKEAYLTFLQAAQLNHKKAKEYVALGYLFGDYLPQNVAKAVELFTELADTGSPKAQTGLAFMYSAGMPFNSSQAKALIYLTFGALGGDPLAQMALGYRYYAGVGVESKCETALTYYRKVATKVADSVTLAGGPVVQRIRLQEETESQGTNNGPLLDDDLLQYYHFLADKGDQQAQVVLGTLYYQGGKGVQINHEQAYHYFSIAADSGSGHALGYLGKMHSEGSPVVSQSNHTAFEYFKKSADKNNHIGQTGLGMMYLNGLGVEKDTSKAFRYFSLASDQGSVDAQLQLGIMYFTGNGVRKDYKMAVKYFTMSSQNGHVLAFYNLAQMHATGTGVLRNCHTAVELFKNVAERGRWSEMLMDAHRMYHEGSVDTALVKYMFLAELGYEVAQSNVAYMLDSGLSTKFENYESHQRALLQYSRAASQGSTHARLKMGDYHYYGLGTEIDYESAASHYRMASEQQHNAQAMFNLGYMHEKGLGLKQDVHLAKRFYDMAAETSLDAHVPVTLALFKLGIFYGMDVFNKEFEGVSGIVGMLNPESYLGPEWDLYLASVMAILLGVLYFLRRMR